MAYPDTPRTPDIGEVWRARLQEAGLEKALALFPDDVRVAVATAVLVRESFGRLPAAVPA